MSNCANGIAQSFKHFHKVSGVRECVQLCTGEKRSSGYCLKKRILPSSKAKKDEGKNYNGEGRTDAQNNMDASQKYFVSKIYTYLLSEKIFFQKKNSV